MKPAVAKPAPRMHSASVVSSGASPVVLPAPWNEARRLVKSVATDGRVQGACAKAFSKRSPSEASRPSCGVVARA